MSSETFEKLEAELGRVEHVARDLAEALFCLHAEVEMGEAVGICLPDRVPSLRAGMLLDRHHDYLPEVTDLPPEPFSPRNRSQ